MEWIIMNKQADDAAALFWFNFSEKKILYKTNRINC